MLFFYAFQENCQKQLGERDRKILETGGGHGQGRLTEHENVSAE